MAGGSESTGNREGSASIQFEQPIVADTIQIVRITSASPACSHLAGTGSVIRVAIAPSGFDGFDPDDVSKLDELADVIASAFVSTEPYASNLDRFSISRADDFRGSDVDDSNIWYSPVLIEAAGIYCGKGGQDVNCKTY